MGDDNPDLSPLGVFSYVKPVSVGEDGKPNPYHPPGAAQQQLHRIKDVRQFQTNNQKKGQTGDNWGPKARPFDRLYEGEVYKDPQKNRIVAMKKNREKFIAERGFIPSSPPKRATGPGGYEGTFDKPVEHMADGLFDRRATRKPAADDDDEGERKPMYTSPVKKGTFGYPRLLIGGKDAPVLGGEYAHDRMRVLQSEERKKHEGSVGDRKAFLPMCYTREYFDGARSVAASTVYEADEKCLAPKPDPREGMTPKQHAEKMFDERGFEKDFTPTHPPRSGAQGYFDKFPEHLPDGYTADDRKKMEPTRLQPASRRMKLIPEKLRERPTFKPTSTPKSSPTMPIFSKSIYKANLGRRR